MITRAIIEEKLNNYKFKVRIPFYNKSRTAPSATSTADLHTAVVCTMPNADLNYQVGDAVFVGFEDNDISKPVILGQLYREEKTNSNPILTCESVKVKVDTFLPSETFIGKVQPAEISYLAGANKNLQFQLDILEEKIAKLEEALSNTLTVHIFGIFIEEKDKILPNNSDIDLLSHYIAGWELDLKPWQIASFDLNNDGIIDFYDMTLLMRAVEGEDISKDCPNYLKHFIYLDNKIVYL